MSTLLLRLAGPMQSWGTQSRFTERDTGHEPSKSGVIGLLCAALGWSRDVDPQTLARLARLQMGVRIDRPGIMRVDYQTAGGSHKKGQQYGVAVVDGGMRTSVSRRYYLADADFLVGLAPRDGDMDGEATLHMIDDALKAPVWPLFLGRRAFVPSEPVRLPDNPPERAGWRTEPLRDALLTYPWPEPRRRRETIDHLQFVFETETGAAIGADVRRDVPISFRSNNRVFDVRYIQTVLLGRPEAVR